MSLLSPDAQGDQNMLGDPVLPKLKALRNQINPSTVTAKPAVDPDTEFLNSEMLSKGGPLHPGMGVFMSGPYRGRTPDQVREQLLAQRRGTIAPGAGPGGGLRTGSLGTGDLTRPNVPMKAGQPVSTPATPMHSAAPTPSPAPAAATQQVGQGQVTTTAGPIGTTKTLVSPYGTGSSSTAKPIVAPDGSDPLNRVKRMA